MPMQSLKKIGQKILKLENGNEAQMDERMGMDGDGWTDVWTEWYLYAFL